MDTIETRLSLNQRLIKEKQQGILQAKYLNKDPFLHAVIPDVLNKDFFNKIKDSILKSDDFEDTGDSNIQHHHMNSPELLKVLLSNEMKEIIGEIFSCKVVRKKDQYPSLECFPQTR